MHENPNRSPSGVTVRLLVENTAHREGFLGEHGLSYWIDTPSGPVLFDTGGGRTLVENLKTLGRNLREVRAVVLSHGHNDHTGGLKTVVEAAPRAPVFLHPAALEEKYAAGPEGRVRDIGTAFLRGKQFLEETEQIRFTESPTLVLCGVYTTGEVPRRNGFEDVGGRFYLDPEGNQPDPIRDDQSLYFESSEGWVVILGCAHAGVVNTLDTIAGITGTDRFHAVIGGMHLLHAESRRLEATYAAFDRYRVEVIGPCHCTGLKAVAGFWKAFPDRCVEVHAGSTFTFPLPLAS